MIKKTLGLALLFAASTAYGLSLSDIETAVRIRIKDTHATRQRYTDAQLDAFINEGQRDVINNTWAIRVASSIALNSGTTYYTLPSDVIQIERVALDNRSIPETTLIKLDAENEDWSTGVGKPSQYFQDPAQPNKIGVQPWPSTTTHLGTLSVTYFAEATDLSSDSDVPFNGETRFSMYHDLLVLYATYRVYLIEGELDKANLYRQEYDTRLFIMHERIGSKPNYVPGMGGPNTSR